MLLTQGLGSFQVAFQFLRDDLALIRKECDLQRSYRYLKGKGAEELCSFSHNLTQKNG